MLSLSNHDVPARHRLAFLHDFVARSVAGLEFTPGDDDRFRFEIHCRNLRGATVVGSARYSRVRGERTRELTADGRQNYMLTIHDEAYEVSVTGGRRFGVAAGDIVIVHEGLRQSFDLPDTGLTAIVLDERQMVELVPAISKSPVHHVAAAAPGAMLLAGYAHLLLDGATLDETGAHLAADQLHQLACVVLAGHPNAVRTDLAGVGGARLALVKEDVARNLSDPELDIATVARRQGVTPRYVQQLFERQGTSFSRYLREARLDRARVILREHDGRTISAVAFDCGFGDLSHFNKAFRQRFGLTPSDIRAAALRALS
jgi:AraC-like DNA-binding protein